MGVGDDQQRIGSRFKVCLEAIDRTSSFQVFNQPAEQLGSNGFTSLRLRRLNGTATDPSACRPCSLPLAVAHYKRLAETLARLHSATFAILMARSSVTLMAQSA
jgi:hypothetical protein